nr:hypothetical protein [Tanacetum cinerariifolium]
MSYEALPPDARAYLDQWDDGTTKPKHNDDDEDVWFCNAWNSKPKIQQEEPKPLPYVPGNDTRKRGNVKKGKNTTATRKRGNMKKHKSDMKKRKYGENNYNRSE